MFNKTWLSRSPGSREYSTAIRLVIILQCLTRSLHGSTNTTIYPWISTSPRLEESACMCTMPVTQNQM
jgi:hypothetical protein